MANFISLPKILRTLAVAVLAVFWYQYVLISLASSFVTLPRLFPPYSAFGMLLVVFFAAAHAWYALGPRNAATFFGLSVLLTWWIEQFGVVSGLVFGRYHYTSSGFLIGDVPIEIPLLWFGLLYLGYTLANAIGGHVRGVWQGWPELAWLSLLGAAVVTARDAVIEPILARPGVLNRPWVWEEAGEYFGVPVQNFVGWMFTAFVIYIIYRSLERVHALRPLGRPTHSFMLLPVMFYVGLMVVDLMNANIPSELPIIALFAMGVPALIAAWNIVVGSAVGWRE